MRLSVEEVDKAAPSWMLASASSTDPDTSTHWSTVKVEKTARILLIPGATGLSRVFRTLITDAVCELMVLCAVTTVVAAYGSFAPSVRLEGSADTTESVTTASA